MEHLRDAAVAAGWRAARTGTPAAHCQRTSLSSGRASCHSSKATAAPSPAMPRTRVGVAQAPPRRRRARPWSCRRGRRRCEAVGVQVLDHPVGEPRGGVAPTRGQRLAGPAEAGQVDGVHVVVVGQVVEGRHEGDLGGRQPVDAARPGRPRRRPRRRSRSRGPTVVWLRRRREASGPGANIVSSCTASWRSPRTCRRPVVKARMPSTRPATMSSHVPGSACRRASWSSGSPGETRQRPSATWIVYGGQPSSATT